MRTCGSEVAELWRGVSGKKVWQLPPACVSLTDMKSKLIDNGVWTARADQVIQITSPEIAAEKLGQTVKAVLARRQELGLADRLSSREHRARRKANSFPSPRASAGK